MKLSLKPSTMPEENLGPVSAQSLQPLFKKNPVEGFGFCFIYIDLYTMYDQRFTSLNYFQEFDLLFYNLRSARIFFRSSTDDSSDDLEWKTLASEKSKASAIYPAEE